MSCPNLVVAASAGDAAAGDYVKNKDGEDCDKVKEKSGCEAGNRCATDQIMGEDLPGMLGGTRCVAEATCGTSEAGLLGMDKTVVCSSSVLAASMVTVIGVMTQM